MKKPVLPFLEIMTIRTCNLSCQGCTTFSDLKYSGYVTWNQAHDWLSPWKNRLDIEAVGVMGGEPLINPEIRDWIVGLRNLLPSAQIRFVTNGLLLEKHWDVVEMLQSMGNTVLKISHHLDDPRLESAINRVFNSWAWEPIEEFGIQRWARENQLRFQIARPGTFIKTFQGEYQTMRPHDNAPADAFDICVQQKCPLLYNGKIYKCGTVGLTPELLERVGWPNEDLWQPYLDSGLAVDCSEPDLKSFVNNFGKPHQLCRQCPSKHDTGSIVNHRKTVTFKKIENV